MGDAIGEMLPSAVGVAVSPLPIVAIVLMLATERARSNGPAFAGGWCLGILVLGGVVLLISSGAEASDEGAPATWVSLLQLALGLGLLAMAVKQWQGRPKEGETPEAPSWLASLDGFTPIKAAGIGAFLGSINPKNLILVSAGAAAIAQTGIAAGEQAIALVVFMLIASVGVLAPVAIFFALGDRSRDILDGLRSWMTDNNATIMAVVLLILGAKLAGDAIVGLA